MWQHKVECGNYYKKENEMKGVEKHLLSEMYNSDSHRYKN